MPLGTVPEHGRRHITSCVRIAVVLCLEIPTPGVVSVRLVFHASLQMHVPEASPFSGESSIWHG